MSHTDDNGHGDPRDFDGFDRDAWIQQLEQHGGDAIAAFGVPADKPKVEISAKAESEAELDHEGLQFDDEIAILVDTYHALVKGLLYRAELAFLYGPSGCGKTFFLLCLCYSIANGRHFLGRKVRRAPILYVGLEGQRGLENRIAAAAKVYGTAGRYFARLTVPALLNKSADGKRGLAAIIAAIHRLERITGERIGLVVIDTLSRAIAGDDENAAQDMSAFLQLRAAEIQRRTGAACLLVHHCGKDIARGMRGSCALFGAAETVLQIDENRSVTIEKSRDGATGPLCTFKLKPITLATDQDGDPITTCTVEIAATPPSEKPIASKRAKLPEQAKRALDVLNRLYTSGKAFDVPLSSIGLEGVEPAHRPRVVTLEEWRTACTKARLVPDGKPSSERMAFVRAVEKLDVTGLVARYSDFAWKIGQRRDPAQAVTERHTCAPCDGPTAHSTAHPSLEDVQSVQACATDSLGPLQDIGDPSLDSSAEDRDDE